MRRLIIASIALSLCSCQSAEEKKVEWIGFCIKGEFTKAQCEVLYSIKESSDDSASAAQSAQMMSGFAIGMSAGSVGRR